jgi:hypothetical protein
MARAGGSFASRTAPAQDPKCLHTVTVLGQRGYWRLHSAPPASGNPSTSALLGAHS